MKLWSEILNLQLCAHFLNTHAIPIDGENRMSVSPLKQLCRYVIAGVLACALPLGMWAQDAAQSSAAQPSQPNLPQAPTPAAKTFTLTDYSKPRRAFPNVIAPYER